MAQVAGSPGEFTLSSLNDTTGWLPLSGLADDPTFTITGTFSGTISIRISNQAHPVKTRYNTLPTTYTLPTESPLAIPRIAGRWFCFVMTAYTSGTAYIGLTAPNRAGTDGTPSSVSPQVSTNVPPVDEF
jgi:hypothetical protein